MIGPLSVSVDTRELQAQLARLTQLATQVPSELAQSVLSSFFARLEDDSLDIFVCENVTALGADGVHFRMQISAVEYERVLLALGADHVYFHGGTYV